MPTTAAEWYNTSVVWSNNSRLLSVAVPEGTPPAGGWPVMIDLLVVDFGDPSLPSRLSLRTGRRGQPRDPGGRRVGKLHTRRAEAMRQRHRLCLRLHDVLLAAQERPEFGVRRLVQLQAARADVPCRAAAAEQAVRSCDEQAVNWTKSLPIGKHKGHEHAWRNCTQCMSSVALNLTSAPNATMLGCPDHTVANATDRRNESRYDFEMGFCANVRPKYPAGGGGGGGEQNRYEKGHLRNYFPFASPHRLGRSCSCIIGTDNKFDCSPPYDDDAYGQPFVPKGAVRKRKPGAPALVPAAV